MRGTPSIVKTMTTTTTYMHEPMKEKGILVTPLGDIRVAEGKDLRTPGNGYTNRTTGNTSTMMLNWMFVRNDVKLHSSAKTLN